MKGGEEVKPNLLNLIVLNVHRELKQISVLGLNQKEHELLVLVHHVRDNQRSLSTLPEPRAPSRNPDRYCFILLFNFMNARGKSA